MKIDLNILRAIEKNGGSAAMMLAVIEAQVEAHEAKRAKKRPVEAASKKRKPVDSGGTECPKVERGGNEWKQVEQSDAKRQEATLDDTARARLFREGTAALLTLGRTERAARGLIAGWLKATHDDEQLVLATILKAQSLAVADYAGWITSNLSTRSRNGQRDIKDIGDDLVSRAKELEREAGLGEPDAETVGSAR